MNGTVGAERSAIDSFSLVLTMTLLLFLNATCVCSIGAISYLYTKRQTRLLDMKCSQHIQLLRQDKKSLEKQVDRLEQNNIILSEKLQIMLQTVLIGNDKNSNTTRTIHESKQQTITNVGINNDFDFPKKIRIKPGSMRRPMSTTADITKAYI